MFEISKVSFTKWLYAMHMVVNARKSVSACQMNREIGGSYMTSWRLLHKVRGAMQERNEYINLFKLIEEINKNHIKEREEACRQQHSQNEESHKLLSAVNLMKFIEENMGKSDEQLQEILLFLENEELYGVKQSDILLDSMRYTNSHVKTKKRKILWTLINRGIRGQFHHISTKYLINYISEFTWRFNNRDNGNTFFDLLERSLLVPI